MKKLLVLVVLAVLALVAACSEDEDGTIIGTWFSITDDGKRELIIKETTIEFRHFESTTNLMAKSGKKGTYIYTNAQLDIKFTQKLNNSGMWISMPTEKISPACVRTGFLMTLTKFDGAIRVFVKQAE